MKWNTGQTYVGCWISVLVLPKGTFTRSLCVKWILQYVVQNDSVHRGTKMTKHDLSRCDNKGSSFYQVGICF